MAEVLDPTDNPFSQYDPDKVGELPAPEAVDADNPFAKYGPKPVAPQGSATGAFGRAAERGVVPALGGLAAAGAGAEAGAAIGAIGGPIGVAAGAIIGGIGGGLVGSYGASKAQDYALSKAPDSWKEAIGQDERQQQLDEANHPYASFLGGIAPYALTMRPGGFARAALPENATSFQRLMANPITARVFGGAAMGGMELGNEAASQEDLDWRKAAIATGFGLVFNKPTRLGEAVTELGARPVRGAFGIEGPAVAQAPADEDDAPAPTVAQAGDAKVMGPGITEDVFRGAHEQDPSSAMTAQDTARTEQSLTGEPPAGPDIHATVRQMEPELFEHYDGLAARRDTFRNWIDQHNNPPDEALAELDSQRGDLEAKLAATPITGAGQNKPEARRIRAQIRDVQSQYQTLQDRRTAFAAGQGEETIEAAIARQHLADTDQQMRDLAPEVSAAYRRAADAIGSRTFEPGGVPTAADGAVAPPKFRSLAEMIAARGSEGGAPPVAVDAAKPARSAGFEARKAANTSGEKFEITDDNGKTAGIAVARNADGSIDYLKHDDGQIIPVSKGLSNDPAQEVVAKLTLGEHSSSTGPDDLSKVRDITPTAASSPELAESPPALPSTATAPTLLETARSPEQQRAFIADDMRRRLIAAGRPADEAEATGHLLAARYETRAARFGGSLGTAEELYSREGPAIKGPGGRTLPPGRPPGAAQLPEPVAAPRPKAPAGASSNPQSMLAAIRAAGGLKNEGGELDNLQRQYPGLVNNKSGMSLDRARETMAEAGYLGGDTTRAVSDTTVNDLVDALHNHPVYAVHDLDQVLARGEQAARKASAADLWQQFSEGRQAKIEGPGHANQAFNGAFDRNGNPIRGKARQAWEPGNVVDVGFVKDLLVTGKNEDGTYRLLSKPDAQGKSTAYSSEPQRGLSKEDGGKVDFMNEAEPLAQQSTHEELASFLQSHEPDPVAMSYVPEDVRAELDQMHAEGMDFFQNKAVTDTPEFKEWFGNSAVVDRKGEPLVVFHGSPDARDLKSTEAKFATLKQRAGMDDDNAAFFFTNKREVANTYADDTRAFDYQNAEPGVVPAYLSLKNPKTIDWGGERWRGTEDAIDQARSEGHDGIIINNVRDAYNAGLVKKGDTTSTVYVAFEPTQVKSPDNFGSFDPADPRIFHQSARGSIKIGSGRPLISLFKDANASTFIHETGHQWLEELMRDGDHAAAPDVLKDDAQTVRDWLGVDDAADIKTRHHEKFARGFEQYMREGVAPSPALAGVFGKFKNWLVSVYQTIKGLGQPINEDIRGVFDRLIAMEPQRTVIAPERQGGPSLADIHEADAAEIEPHEADAARDRVVSERDRYVQDQHPEIQSEIAPVLTQAEAAAAGRPGQQPVGPSAKPPGEDSAGPGGLSEVVDGGGDARPVAGGGRGSSERSTVEPSGTSPVSEGSGIPRSEQRRSGGTGARSGSELAPGAATFYGSDQPALVDKAGNVRLDTLTTNEDVKEAIRESAAANNDFLGDRRGVVTDGQIMELADALGQDYSWLLKRKVGQAFNAEQILAARKLLIQSATEVSAAMKQAAGGTDEDVLAYAEAKNRHQLIQGQVAGLTAEWGRAGRAFRDISGQQLTQGVDQFLRDATGKTLFQLREEAKLGAQLDSPFQVSKYMQDTMKRSVGRGIMEYFVNNLISGVATHVTYTVGNMALMMERIGIITPAAAGIGAMRSMLGREGESVQLGEVGAAFRGIGQGVAPAIRAVGDSLRTGVTTELPGQTESPTLPLQIGADLAQGAKANMDTKMSDLAPLAFGTLRGMRDGLMATGAIIKAGGVEGAPFVGLKYSPLGVIPDIQVKGVTALPVGNIIRSPGRMVAAIHTLFRVLNYSADVNQQAFRNAATEGLTGNDFNARVADLRQNPTEAMMEASRGTSNSATLMGESGDFMQLVSKLFNWQVDLPGLGNTQPLKFIDPFVHIAGQVMKQSLGTQSPLGLFSAEVRADLTGRNGNVAQDMAQAKMLVGSVLGMTFAGLAAEGYATGGGPTDPHEKAMWQLAGNQAYSIRIGDMWYATHRLGPLGVLTGLGADMHDIAHTANEGDLHKAAALFMHAVSQNFLDEGFMRGPADLLKAIEESDRYGERYISNFGTSFIPFAVGMAQQARAMDPYAREARTFVDAVKSKIPLLSQTLFPRRDVWGEAIPSLSALGGSGLTAIYEQKLNTDPVNRTMMDLSIFPSPTPRKIRNVVLTDQQYDDYARIAGRMTKMNLDRIVNTPSFSTWPAESKSLLIRNELKMSREAAAGIMMMKDPSIIRAASEAKLAKLRGIEK